MAEKFQKGDRVKVEFEGEVSYVYAPDGALDILADGFSEYVSSKAAKTATTLIERPVEPLAPGSVVRRRDGALWAITDKGRVHVTFYGISSSSSHNPKSLAIEVRDNDDFTLIYDGSNK